MMHVLLLGGTLMLGAVDPFEAAFTGGLPVATASSGCPDTNIQWAR